MAGNLDVDIQFDALISGAGKMLEPFLQCQGLAGAQGLVVVRQQQAPAAVEVLAQDVELDHVDADLHGGLEGGKRVAGGDVGRALVTAPARGAELRHPAPYDRAAQAVRRRWGSCLARSMASMAGLG